jgi:CRISPR-associated protein (TIGR03986 family)
MRMPEHVTPQPAHRGGRAPYNFVPLPEKVFHAAEPPPQDRLDPERLHGHIELRVTTETEIYTRCAYPPGEEDREVRESRPRQEFYHHGDPAQPVIPSSSLRGMVRSLVEILSYSRIDRRKAKGTASRLMDKRLIYRAVADQQTATGRAYNDRFLDRLPGALAFRYPARGVRAGYLTRDSGTGGWCIRPAKEIQGIQFVRVPLHLLSRRGFPARENAVAKVYVKPAAVVSHATKRRQLILHYARTDDITKSPQAGFEAATLVYSGKIGSRHMHTAIYEPELTAATIPIPGDMWERFSQDRDRQRGIPCRRVRSAGDPLFYLLDTKGDLEFLGPTVFFRIPYKHSTADYVPEAALDSDGPLDLAEALFGAVNGEGEKGKPHTGAHKGRVYFEDATLALPATGESPFLADADGLRWPSILSSPKPTSYQNYLVQTDPQGRKEALKSYSASPPDAARSAEETTVLRGTKYYWHRGSAAGDLSIDAPTDDPVKIKQYTRIRPVRPGIAFQGRLRFVNLTALELGALLSALEPPDGCRHRLGMGKPLGMGSIRIQPTLVLIDPKRRYRSLNDNGRMVEAEAASKALDACDAFRREIVRHYNGCTDEPLPEDAALWAIPRLQCLSHLLQWERRPPRRDTDYLQDLKDFRDRQVLPAPAAVLGVVEETTKRRVAEAVGRTDRRVDPAKHEDIDNAEIIRTTPALSSLRGLLAQDGSQRQRLDAIDDAVTAELEAMDPACRRIAWALIRKAIADNKKTRDRLRELRRRLTETES